MEFTTAGLGRRDVNIGKGAKATRCGTNLNNYVTAPTTQIQDKINKGNDRQALSDAVEGPAIQSVVTSDAAEMLKRFELKSACIWRRCRSILAETYRKMFIL